MPRPFPGQQSLKSDIAVSAAAVVAAIPKIEPSGDGLPRAGRSHAKQVGLFEHVALNGVQTAVKAAAAVGKLLGQAAHQFLCVEVVFETHVFHLQIENLLRLLGFIDAACLSHHCVTAVPDGRSGHLALLLCQVLGTCAVDDLPLLHFTVGYTVTSAIRDAVPTIAPAIVAAAKTAAKDGPDQIGRAHV